MERAAADDHIFALSGDGRGGNGRLVPTRFAEGPWSPDAQHGGAVAAALARTLERCPAPAPMRFARLTIDLMRAVPMRPLSAVARVVRDGRRIQVLEAALFEGEVEVARASALRVRVADVGVSIRAEPPHPHAAVDAGPGHVPPMSRTVLARVPGFIRAIDYERAEAPQPGAACVAWTRLRCRVVEGETPSPFVRLAALSDCASGTGNALDFTRWSCINPDLTLHVERDPRSEWVAVQAWTHLEPDGIGQSHAILHDTSGPVARAQTSLLIDRMP